MSIGWYENIEDVCAHCGQDAGSHAGGLGWCPEVWPNPYSEWSKTFKFQASVTTLKQDPMNSLCQNCGHRFGTHVSLSNKCIAVLNAKTTFVSYNPPQYKPLGWYPPKDLKDLVDQVLEQETTNQLLTPAPVVKAKPAKKEKKTKPWEEQKFNTPKVPKGEIKYYKPVPNKDHKPVEPGENAVVAPQIISLKEAAEKYNGYLNHYIDWEKIKEVTTSFGGVDASDDPPKTMSGSMLMHQQFYGRSLRDVIREEPPIEALAEVYLRTNASTKSLVQMLVGFAQSAENPAVRKLAEELSTLKLKIKGLDQNFFQALGQSKKWHGECEKKDKEIEQLKAQMADMVPKARPMVPRSFSENGRKFKDIA